MQIIATQKNIRQTPRKLRLVANAVKDLKLEQSLQQLSMVERRASLAIMKVFQQALANAMNNHRLALGDLKLKNILVTEGPRYKRWNAVSRGRAHSIVKRTSHVQVILETKEVAKTQIAPRADLKKKVGATVAKKPVQTKAKVKAKSNTKQESKK